MFGAAEGPLGVNHPVMAKKRSQPLSKSAWFSQVREAAMKLQCTGQKCSLETVGELTTKHTLEHIARQEEATGRTDPTALIRCQPSGGHNAMYVRVKLQSLIPRVQDAEEADVRAEVTWVAGHLEQRLRTGASLWDVSGAASLWDVSGAPVKVARRGGCSVIGGASDTST